MEVQRYLVKLQYFMIQLMINIEITYLSSNSREVVFNKFSEFNKFFHSYIRGKKVWQPLVGPLRLSNGLTEDPKIMCETFADEFSSVYFTGNLSSHVPYQAFCGNLGSILITYESACKRLSIKSWRWS